MRHVEAIPIQECDDSQLATASSDLFLAVHDKRVREYLAKGRLLHGVVKRHGVSEQHSFERLKAARQKMIDGTQESYVLRRHAAVRLGKTVGMLSVMPDLPLYEQKGSLPPSASRRLAPWTRQRVAAQAIGANTVAWVNPLEEGARDMLREVNETIVAEHGQLEPAVWQLVPQRTVEHDLYGVRTALEVAGFQAVRTGHFDDGEAGRHWLPASMVYVAGGDEAVGLAVQALD